MAGLFNRLKTWLGVEIIKNTDLNAEFDNIINNLGPAGMSGWESSIAQMRIQTSPGSFGSESLATSLNGEIERIRYQLNAIIGGPDNVWYDQPALSLSQVNSNLPSTLPPNRIVSGAVVSGSLQPLHLVPSGSARTVVLKCSTTPFIVVINGVTYTFSSDITSSTLSLAPSSNNTALINDATNADGSNKTLGFGALVQDFVNLADGSPGLLREYPINLDTVGSAITNLAGTYQAFSYVHSATTEYFIGYIENGAASTAAQLTKCLRGCFWNSSSAAVPAIGINDDDTVTIMQLIWIYVTTTGTLLAVYTHPRYSGVQPSSSASGDMWYDTVNQTWKQSNGATYAVANATLVGVAMTNGSECVAARSFDWFRSYQNYSNASIQNYSTSEYRTKYDTSLVNVYGSNISFDKDTVRWTTTTLESGLTLSSSTTYFLYLSEVGATYISKYAPYRRFDLGGFYHPYNSWRCLGLFFYNGSSQFDPVMFATISNLNGEFLNDKSIGIEKRKTSTPILYDANAASPVTAGINQISISTIAKSQSIIATSFTAIEDSNNKVLTCSLQCSGRPVMFWITNISSNVAYLYAAGSNSLSESGVGQYAIYVDGAQYITGSFGADSGASSGTGEGYSALGAFNTIITGLAPGVHSFSFYLNCAGVQGTGPANAAQMSTQYIQLCAMEI